MKSVAAEPHREIDFSGAKRGPVIPAEPGKARISYAGRVRPSVGIRYPATLDRQHMRPDSGHRQNLLVSSHSS